MSRLGLSVQSGTFRRGKLMHELRHSRCVSPVNRAYTLCQALFERQSSSFRIGMAAKKALLARTICAWRSCCGGSAADPCCSRLLVRDGRVSASDVSAEPLLAPVGSGSGSAAPGSSIRGERIARHLTPARLMAPRSRCAGACTAVVSGARRARQPMAHGATDRQRRPASGALRGCAVGLRPHHVRPLRHG